MGKILFLHAQHLHGINVDAEGAAVSINRNSHDFAILLYRILDIGIHPGCAGGYFFVGTQVNQVIAVIQRIELIALVAQQVNVRMRITVHHRLQDVVLEGPVCFRNHGDVTPCIVQFINGICNGTISAALNPQLDASALRGIGVLDRQGAEKLYQHKAVFQHLHAVADFRAVVYRHSLRSVELGHCPQFSVGSVVQGILLRVVAGGNPAVTLDLNLCQRLFAQGCRIHLADFDRHRVIIVYILRPDCTGQQQGTFRSVNKF